jgi:hypothetical protein
MAATKKKVSPKGHSFSQPSKSVKGMKSAKAMKSTQPSKSALPSKLSKATKSTKALEIRSRKRNEENGDQSGSGTDILEHSGSVFPDSDDESSFELDEQERPREFTLQEKEMILRDAGFFGGKKTNPVPQTTKRKTQVDSDSGSESDAPKKPKKPRTKTKPKLKKDAEDVEVVVVKLIEEDVNNRYNYKLNGSIEHILVESVVGLGVTVQVDDVCAFTMIF